MITDNIVPIKAARHLSNSSAINKDENPHRTAFWYFSLNKYRKIGTVRDKKMAVTFGLFQLPVTAISLFSPLHTPKNCKMQYRDSMVEIPAIPRKNCLNLKLGILKRAVALSSKK